MMVAEAVAAACRVSGRARLVNENPAPLIVACVTVRSLPPLFESVTVLVPLAPTLTLPNVTCNGLGERVPIVTPWPDTETEARPCEFWSLK